MAVMFATLVMATLLGVPRLIGTTLSRLLWTLDRLSPFAFDGRQPQTTRAPIGALVPSQIVTGSLLQVVACHPTGAEITRFTPDVS